MKRFQTVATVGLGLIGGSVGLALRKWRPAVKVVGIGRDRKRLKMAKDRGAVTSWTTDMAEGLAEADLVVVCTPVGRIVEDVRRAAEHCRPGTLITDAGSTKESIVKALDEGLPRDCRFLGSHPIAGSEKSGIEHARAKLFKNRPAIITPTDNTRAEDIDRLRAFWEGLRAKVYELSPAEHDEILACTSHVPHAVAAALVAAIPERFLRYAGTGLASTTRIARGDAGVWKPILVENRANVVKALERFETQLAALRATIEQGDGEETERILGLAQQRARDLKKTLEPPKKDSSKKDYDALGS